MLLEEPTMVGRSLTELAPYSAAIDQLGNLLASLVFACKDASRALAQSSLKLEDCRPEYDDLGDKEKTVLDEWFTFFSKRYNIVGKVQS